MPDLDLSISDDSIVAEYLFLAEWILPLPQGTIIVKSEVLGLSISCEV